MDFIKKVVNKEGTESSPDFSGKIVGLYFSAHWCPPCRGFTPKLSEKFTLLKEEGKQFEIVFVSSDEDEESARNYFNEMSWDMMIPFDDEETKKLLDSKYQIRGIPTLVLINGDTGATMTTDGRSTLFEVEFDSLSNYAEEKAKKDAERDANLLADNAITRKQSDDSKSNAEILSAQYEAGQEDILTARSRMPILQAALHKAESAIALKKVKKLRVYGLYTAIVIVQNLKHISELKIKLQIAFKTSE
jgi:thiol-disulfide isomerase/thioredoxin